MWFNNWEICTPDEIVPYMTNYFTVIESQQEWLNLNPLSHKGEVRDYFLRNENGNVRAVIKAKVRVWKEGERCPVVVQVVTQLERSSMAELVAYLKEAKEKNWGIDADGLMEKYSLNSESVKFCLDSVFFNK